MMQYYDLEIKIDPKKYRELLNRVQYVSGTGYKHPCVMFGWDEKTRFISIAVRYHSTLRGDDYVETAGSFFLSQYPACCGMYILHHMTQVRFMSFLQFFELVRSGLSKFIDRTHNMRCGRIDLVSVDGVEHVYGPYVNLLARHPQLEKHDAVSFFNRNSGNKLTRHTFLMQDSIIKPSQFFVTQE